MKIGTFRLYEYFKKFRIAKYIRDCNDYGILLNILNMLHKNTFVSILSFTFGSCQHTAFVVEDTNFMLI